MADSTVGKAGETIAGAFLIAAIMQRKMLLGIKKRAEMVTK